MARLLARRQRRERLAGVLIAVIGAAVLVVAVLALRSHKQVSAQAGSDTQVATPSSTHSGAASSSSSPTRRPRPSAGGSAGGGTDSSSSSGVGSQPLVVLNDTQIPDLARDAAARFEVGGWQVSSFEENYSNDIVSTCAYYDPAVIGSKAAALALQKQFPTIKRVVARFPELPAGPVVVVLTLDYTPT